MPMWAMVVDSSYQGGCGGLSGLIDLSSPLETLVLG